MPQEHLPGHADRRRRVTQKTVTTESGAQQHRVQARATSQTGPLERRTVPVRRIVGGRGGW